MGAAVFSGPAAAIDLDIGGAAVVLPKYEGSKEYEVRGFPIIAPSGTSADGTVQFRGLDDLRFRLLNHSGFEAGVLGGYRFGRDQNDAHRLGGLGDVDGGLVLGAYAAYDFGIAKPFVSYHYQVTGDASGVLRLGAEKKFMIAPGVTMLAIAGTTYADSDYMDDYFTVTGAQAIASAAAGVGLPAYDANAGFKDVYFTLATDVPLTDVWSLKLAGSYKHLIGDAADSPIVETNEQFIGVVGLTYRFNAGP